MAKSVMLICAHPDDQVISVGGALARHAKEGHEVHTIIFSYGELTHPIIKKKVLRRERKKEVLKANEVMRGKGVDMFGIDEGKLAVEIKKEEIQKNLERILKKHKPNRIYTHLPEDPRPDHKAVGKGIVEKVEELGLKTEIYCFERWGILKFRRRDYPKAYINITDTFRTKMDALSFHRSHMLVLFLSKLSATARALINGLRQEVRYAEVFYRLN